MEAFRQRTLRKEIVPKQMRVDNYIRTWLDDIKKPSLKPASFDRLERTFVKQIEKTVVGRSQLGSLTSKDVQILINECSMKYSYSTIKKVYALLNDCLHYAVVVRDLNFNIMEGVTMPKQENLVKQTKKIRLLSKEEITRIEDSMHITYSNGEPRFKYAAAYVLIAYTGIRSGEALALTWESVNFSDRTISIKQSASRVRDRENDKGSVQIITSVKTRAGQRIIPLGENAWEALIALKQYQEKHCIHTDYVIATSTGKMVVQNSFYRIFQKMQLSLGIEEPVSIHSLRHFFGSTLVEKNVNVKVVSSLMGHSRSQVTMDTYVHSNFAQEVEAVKKLDSPKASSQ